MQTQPKRQLKPSKIAWGLAMLMLVSPMAWSQEYSTQGIRLAVLENTASDTTSETLVNPSDGTPADMVDYNLLTPPPTIDTHVPLNNISPDTLRKFVSVVDLVRRRYAGDIDDEVLLRNATSGVLSHLDGHAEFLDETAFKNLQTFTSGGIANVGFELSFDDNLGQWVVVSVIPESSATALGIDIGDYVYQIGEKKLEGLSDKDVSQLLSGVAGSQVEVIVSRAGRAKRTVKLQRMSRMDDKISITMMEGIAVVKLPVFTDKTRQELMEALVRIGQPIKGMIIDVRDNPGGVLSSAISVASMFMEEQAVVQIVEKDRKPKDIYTTNQAPLASMPVIVLQNRYSASAAEVMALAFQADKESLVAGETSYGKGSVQSIIPLGDDEAVKLTTAHYQSPKGDKIDGVGIKPDIALDFNNPLWFVDLMKTMQSKKLDVGVTMSLSSDY